MADSRKKFLNKFKIQCKDRDGIKIGEKQHLLESQLEDFLVSLSLLSFTIKNINNNKKIFKDISKVKIYNSETKTEFNLDLDECRKACNLFKEFFDKKGD